jgi:hypothetical protein
MATDTTESISIPDFRELCKDSLLSEGQPIEDAEVGAEVILYAELRKNNQGAIKIVSGALKADKDAGEIEICKFLIYS